MAVIRSASSSYRGGRLYRTSSGSLVSSSGTSSGGGSGGVSYDPYLRDAQGNPIGSAAPPPGSTYSRSTFQSTPTTTTTVRGTYSGRLGGGGGSGVISPSTPVASTLTGTLLASGKVVPQSIALAATRTPTQYRGGGSTDLGYLYLTEEEGTKRGIGPMSVPTFQSMPLPPSGLISLGGSFAAPEVKGVIDVNPSEVGTLGLGAGYYYGRTVTFIDTLGGLLPELPSNVRAGSLPLTPSPAAAAQIFSGGRSVITGFTQTVGRRKVITEAAFEYKPYFPLARTERGIATTETLFFGTGRAQPYVGTGVGNIIKSGKAGKIFGAGEAGVAFIGKERTVITAGLGRVAPNLLQAEKTLPYATAGIAKRAGRSEEFIGLIGRTFVGRGDAIPLRGGAIETAGLFKEVTRTPVFEFIPLGAKGGRAALLPRFDSLPAALEIGARGRVGLLQAQRLASFYRPTQTLKVSGLLPLYGVGGVLSGSIVGRSFRPSDNLLSDFARGFGLQATRPAQTQEFRYSQRYSTRLISAPYISGREISSYRFIDIARPIQRTRTFTIPGIINVPKTIFGTPPATTFRTPTTFKPPRIPGLPPGIGIPPGFFLTLKTRPGRGSSLFGAFYPRYSPSLTARAFRLFGRPSKKALTGQVTPFERRYLLFGKRRRGRPRKRG